MIIALLFSVVVIVGAFWLIFLIFFNILYRFGMVKMVTFTQCSPHAHFILLVRCRVYFINIQKRCCVRKRLWRGVKNYLSRFFFVSSLVLSFFTHSLPYGQTDWSKFLVVSWLYVILIVPTLICVHVEFFFLSFFFTVVWSSKVWSLLPINDHIYTILWLFYNQKT